MRRKENNFYWKLEGKRQVATNFSALGSPRALARRGSTQRIPCMRASTAVRAIGNH